MYIYCSNSGSEMNWNVKWTGHEYEMEVNMDMKWDGRGHEYGNICNIGSDAQMALQTPRPSRPWEWVTLIRSLSIN